MNNRIRDYLDKARVRAEDYVGHDEPRNEKTVRDGFLPKAKAFLRRLPIATEVVALYFCLLDAKTPLWAKGVAAAALAYFVLPIDAIPDFLPLVGLTDDLSVLTGALATVGAVITDEHRDRARQWMAHERLV